jgi:hypothetical protein
MTRAGGSLSVAEADALAQSLVEAAKGAIKMDPVVLLALIVPRKELLTNTDFGGPLLKLVERVGGERAMQNLAQVAEALKRLFLDMQVQGLVPQPLTFTVKGEGGEGLPVPRASNTVKACTDWRKKDTIAKVRDHPALQQEGRVFMPAVTQVVTTKKYPKGNNKETRQFVVYEYIQDMMAHYCR